MDKITNHIVSSYQAFNYWYEFSVVEIIFKNCKFRRLFWKHIFIVSSKI